MALKDLCKKTHLLKLPILCMVFIVMIMARCGNDGDSLGWFDISELPDGFSQTDLENFMIMVGYGYFYIMLVQIISIIAGEKWPIMNLIFSLCGFVFYMAVGSMRIAFTRDGVLEGNKEVKLAMGSLAIINSLLFLIDAGFAFMARKNLD